MFAFHLKPILLVFFHIYKGYFLVVLLSLPGFTVLFSAEKFSDKLFMAQKAVTRLIK